MIDHEAAARAALRARGVLIVEQGGRGGVADYTSQLAAGLERRSMPVTIATAEDHLYPHTSGVRTARVFHYVRGHSRLARRVRHAGLGPVANGLRFLGSLPALLALSRRHAVTHVQGWEAASLGLVATLLFRGTGVTLVYTAHNTFERLPRRLDGTRIFPALSRQTIVHTEADRDRVSRAPVVIPHGHYLGLAARAPDLDPGHARSTLGLPADAPVVLLFGVLRPDKGLGDLLEAVRHVPDWHVVIAGEDHGGLAAVAERLRSPAFTRRVTVLEGFQPIDQVGRLFAAADLVALPYRRASQSGVLHLAYGFARPVVAYPVGGLGEAMVPGGTGWLLPEASPSSLANALREAGAAGRPELRRRGEEGRRWAQHTFDWDRIAERTESVYVRALVGDSGERSALSASGDGASRGGGVPAPRAGAPAPRPPESPPAPPG